MGTGINFFVELRKKERWISSDKLGEPERSVNGEMIGHVRQEARYYSDRKL